MVIYIGQVNPYKSNTHHFFEMFNEAFIFIFNYHLMCCADFIKEQETLYLMGWSMIFFISLNLLVNLTFIMFGVFKELFNKYRLKYYKKKHARLTKAKAKRDAAYKSHRELK